MSGRLGWPAAISEVGAILHEARLHQSAHGKLDQNMIDRSSKQPPASSDGFENVSGLSTNAEIQHREQTHGSDRDERAAQPMSDILGDSSNGGSALKRECLAPSNGVYRIFTSDNTTAEGGVSCQEQV